MEQKKRWEQSEAALAYLAKRELACRTVDEYEACRLAALLITHWMGHPHGEQCWHRDAFECAHIRMYGGTWAQIERKRLYLLSWQLGIRQLPDGVHTHDQLWRWCIEHDTAAPGAVPKKPAARVEQMHEAAKAGAR